MIRPLIALRDVQFRWHPQEPCLDIAELDIATGERVFLHGPSGSGKSTLLGLLGGINLPQSGELRCLGQDMQQISVRARDRFRVDHIGFVFQQFNLLPYLSVLDNVLLPCRFSRLRRQRALDTDRSERAAAIRLLTHLDLPESLYARPAQALSTGQQQRVAVARALIGQPELVIADEPTSALDAARQSSFLDLLGSECAAAGSTLLFVSHDMRLASHFNRTLALPSINRAALPEVN